MAAAGAWPMTSPSEPKASSPGSLRVRLFASLVEAVGAEEVSLPAEGDDTVGTLESRLRDEHEGLRETVFRIAVDQAYAQTGDPVRPGQEIALLPPVSGG